nr:transposase [Bradyrhizobium sp. 6(2017)]
MGYVARRHGLSPSLVFRWRRLMSERGKEAVRADEDGVAASEVRRLEERVRDLERMLGRKTLEVEILKEALDLARVKNRPCCRDRRRRRIPREADRRDPRGGPFQPGGVSGREASKARSPDPRRGCRAHFRYPAPGG